MNIFSFNNGVFEASGSDLVFVFACFAAIILSMLVIFIMSNPKEKK